MSDAKVEPDLDLEVPLRDLAYMAGIARDLSWELLDGETRKKPDEYVVLRLLPRQHEHFCFQSIRLSPWPATLRSSITSDLRGTGEARGGFGRPFCASSVRRRKGD
jgi:hypothetical protein